MDPDPAAKLDTLPDFLLSASLFQKQAALSLQNRSSPCAPLINYLSSLWLQEIPDSNPAAMKNVERVLCPYCGAGRDADTVRVRIKGRKSGSARNPKNLGKHRGNCRVPEDNTGRLDGPMDQLTPTQAAAKNRMVLRCQRCLRSCSHSGISQSMQRRLLAEQTVKCSLRPAENIVDVDSSFSPKKSGMSHMSGKPKSLACTTDSQPVVSNCTKRKKRKKDLNAGLIIPSALYFSGTTPKGNLWESADETNFKKRRV